MIYRMTRILSLATLSTALGVALFVPGVAGAATWTADSAHTEIRFSVDHFFTPVHGAFRDFEIELDYDAENPENSTVEARIQVASLDTGNTRRDEHLRSADWFEAETYPAMTFKSTSVRRNGESGLIARGQLTIRGESQEIELQISLLGVRQIPEPMRPMLGGSTEVASFKATAAVDREDFQVGVGDWAGTMVVGGEVEIEILLEAHLR